MSSNPGSRMPPSLAGSTGWPWRTDDAPLIGFRPIAELWPKISIVTPSLNQGTFIEETIRSVLLQGYPNLEYIVIDGGSVDDSVEIIRRYSPWLKHWVSELDHGQGHAINKGFARASGDILGFLNSDDIYLPGTLHAVAARFREVPNADLVHGSCRIIDQDGCEIGRRRGNIVSLDEILNLWEVWWAKQNFVQPEVFWTRRIAEKVGPFREDLHFVMDYEYWLRILAAGGSIARLDRELAAFRLWSDQKSQESERVADELLRTVRAPLWDPSTAIPRRLRWRLQAMWLYQAEFLAEVQRSLAAGEARTTRWPRLSWCFARHPKLLLAPGLYQRLWSVARGHASAQACPLTPNR